METLLDNKSDNFKFLTPFSLDIRAWSTETQTNIALFVAYEPILRHCSLCTPTEIILSSHFLLFSGGIERDIWHEVGLMTLRSNRSQMFFRAGVLKNFAMFKGKHMSWSLSLIKLQPSSPAALLKRDSNSGIWTAFFIEQFRLSSWLLFFLYVAANAKSNVALPENQVLIEDANARGWKGNALKNASAELLRSLARIR